MLSDSIRSRIESLRLSLLEKNRVTRLASGKGRVRLEDVGDFVEVTNQHGKCVLIERQVDQYVSAKTLQAAARVLLGKDDSNDYIFLDLETTGLASTPLFLAGTLYESDGALVVGQLLARDYSEEASLISHLDCLLDAYQTCITFNGKAFDLPYVRERAKYHRIDIKASPEHFDLLHHARRRWKHQLPNCRLMTLEWYILGRRRLGDVASWEVPCIYHDFVHTKDADRLLAVLRHNLVDVLSMAELFINLSEGRSC